MIHGLYHVCGVYKKRRTTVSGMGLFPLQPHSLRNVGQLSVWVNVGESIDLQAQEEGTGIRVTVR